MNEKIDGGRDCQHRKEVLYQNARGRDVFNCRHVANPNNLAVLESCGTCSKGMWVCENCPGFDRESKQFVYPKPQPIPLPPDIRSIVPDVRPLRIIFQTNGWNMGGAERWILSLCNEFDRSKVRPAVIAVDKWEQQSPVMLSAVPSDVAILPLETVRKQWSAFGDLIIHWGASPIDGRLPTVSVLHHAGTECKYTKKAVRVAIQANVPIVGVNEACRAVLPKTHRGLMTVIENGADEQRVFPTCGRAEIRASYGIRPDQKVVAHIGRIMSDKDVPALAKAVGELSEEWMLLACGPVSSVSDLSELEQLAKGRFRYLPPRDHIGDVLAAADVFALLSPSEAHPLGETEAWLAGVPVVSTRLPWLLALEEKHGDLAVKVGRQHDTHAVAAALQVAFGRNVSKIQAIAQNDFTSKAMARRWERYLLGDV